MLKWIRRGVGKEQPVEVYGLFEQTYLEQEDDYDFDSVATIHVLKVGGIENRLAEQNNQYVWDATIYGTKIKKKRMPPVYTLREAQEMVEQLYLEFKAKRISEEEAIKALDSEWEKM